MCVMLQNHGTLVGNSLKFVILGCFLFPRMSHMSVLLIPAYQPLLVREKQSPKTSKYGHREQAQPCRTVLLLQFGICSKRLQHAESKLMNMHYPSAGGWMMLSPELSPHVSTKGSGVYRLSWSSVYSTAFQCSLLEYTASVSGKRSKYLWLWACSLNQMFT